MALSYSAGGDNSHPHFYGPDEIDCSDCGQPVPAESGVLCTCGCVIDDDLIRDFLEAVGEPDEDWGADR